MFKKLHSRFFKWTYAPWGGFFSVTVNHEAPSRNAWGWDAYDFWFPWTALRFAKREVGKDENRHATVYYRVWYWMPGKVVCRIVKEGGVVKRIKEFGK